MGLILLLIAACGSPSRDGEEAAPDTANARVAVEDLEYSRLPGGARILTGRVINPTPRDVRTAQVQITLYDEHNRSRGSMLVVVQNVPAGEEKEFREPVELDDAAGARVRAIMTQ